MKPQDTVAEMSCPACGAPLTIPVTLRMTGRATASVTFNTLAVQAHLEKHEEAPGEQS